MKPAEDSAASSATEILRSNLQIHRPEGNVRIRRSVVNPAGGVPDYNARVKMEKSA